MTEKENNQGGNNKVVRPSGEAADKDIEKILNVGDQFEKYNMLSKVILRELNSRKASASKPLYSKDQIVQFLSDPYRNGERIRAAVQYIYSVSSHFRRLIKYFVSLNDLSYVISPYNIKTDANMDAVGKNYRKTLADIESMNIQSLFPRILTICFREDVYFGTIWNTGNGFALQQLPTSFCAISSIEDSVFNISFNFTYFDSRKEELDYYPEEFRAKYNLYLKDRTQWIELDSPNSFALKVNSDTPDVVIPPFAGILREIYDIEDYKRLKLSKTEIENYAMLAMRLPMDDDGTWGIDLDKAQAFWRNLDSVLPDEIGSILTPMPIEKIDFDRSGNSEKNNIAEAEQNLFTAAGVSSLLFNNEKASANALLLSIKADQSITFELVKGLADIINRFLSTQRYSKNFRISFLDTSPFNRKEVSDAYLKACTFGMPFMAHYCASQGMSQSMMEGMLMLENDILDISTKLRPLLNSAQMPTSISEESAQGGRPPLEAEELTESAEQNQEDA